MNWVFEVQIVGFGELHERTAMLLRMKRGTSWFSKPLLWFIKWLLSLKQYYSKPVSDFLTSCANISLHRDEQEVGGCSWFFLFMRHTTWSIYANYATSTKGLNQWKIKNVPVHSKQKEKPKKFFFFFLPNNLHIPKELGLNIFLIRMGLRAHYLLLHKLGLNAQTSSPDELALRLLTNIFTKHILHAVTSP